MRIIFFGSTADSVLVLEKLRRDVCAVVTQPPRPVGRKHVVTPTPVEFWAKQKDVPVLSFPSDVGKPWLFVDEAQVIDALQPLKADLLVSACFGQKIPWEAIKETRYGGLNVHPSLLPRWRGADPVPWAILSGDHQTGVSVVTLSKEFDEGNIIAQKKIPITDTDTSDPLRTRLFTIGADLLMEVLAKYPIPTPYTLNPKPSPLSSYARRLTRDDGFEPWEAIQNALENAQEAWRIDRKFRAFTPWPGVWTKIQVKSQKSGVQGEEKRLKILRVSLVAHRVSLEAVQLEGKRPVSWQQFTRAYRFPT